MKGIHPIAEEVLEAAATALAKGQTWMAYNDVPFLLEKEDVAFYKNKEDAIEFIINNYGVPHQFELMSIRSVEDVLRKIPYGPISSQQAQLQNEQLAVGKGASSGDGLSKQPTEPSQSLFNLSLTTENMKQENFEFLANSVKYAGFGDGLKSDLESAMRKGEPEFQLQFATEWSKKPFEATLNFRKSDSSDMYFLNSYHASLQRNDGRTMEQTFYLNKGKGVTAKEAFNLLDGRAVHKDLVTKEGQPYKAWLQLDPEVKDKNGNMDMKQIHENYGYDLKAAVNKFPVAEMADPKQEKALLESLQKGNVQAVTLEKDGSTHKMFLEADPRFKSVKLYDAQMKLVTKEGLSSYQSVGKEAAPKTVKEDVGQDKKKELSKTEKTEKNKLEKKTGLLPKKREGTKKGLGIA